MIIFSFVLFSDTESKSETETVSENQGLFSDDPDEESLQKQVSSKPAKQAVSRTEVGTFLLFLWFNYSEQA